MNNFTKSVLYSTTVLVAGLVAIFAIYNNVSTSPDGSSLAQISPAAGTSDLGISYNSAVESSGSLLKKVSENASSVIENTSEVVETTIEEAVEATTENADEVVEKANIVIEETKEIAPEVSEMDKALEETEETMKIGSEINEVPSLDIDNANDLQEDQSTKIDVGVE